MRERVPLDARGCNGAVGGQSIVAGKLNATWHDARV